jgi:hypothetical protein
MRTWSLLASVIGILAIVSTLQPAIANARAGGFGGAHGGFAFRGIGHPIGVHRFMAPRRSASFSVRASPDVRRSERSIAQRHDRFFGPGLPAAGVGVWYGSYFDPTAYGSYFDPAEYVAPTVSNAEPNSALASGRAPAAYAIGCRSQVVTVPSESGGERTVTVTRC